MKNSSGIGLKPQQKIAKRNSESPMRRFIQYNNLNIYKPKKEKMVTGSEGHRPPTIIS